MLKRALFVLSVAAFLQSGDARPGARFAGAVQVPAVGLSAGRLSAGPVPVL